MPNNAIEKSKYYVGDLRTIDPIEIYRKLDSQGLVLFHLPQPLRRPMFIDWFTQCFRLIFHPDSQGDGLTIVRQSRRTRSHQSTRGFTDAALPLHVDGAGQAIPPPVICTLLLREPESGGASILADGREAVRQISLQHPDEYETLTHPGSILISDRPYSLFDHVQIKSRLVIRFRDDGVLVPASPIVKRAIDLFRQLLDMEEITISLRQGQGFLAHNHRWLHGRSAFAGPRIVGRLLGECPSRSDFAVLNLGFQNAWMQSKARLEASP
jgi:alpha-ketoglutarate-dependent taurine dioxygenase